MDTEPPTRDPAAASEAAEQAFYDGVMAQLAGDPAQAERCYRQALDLAGDHLGALHHLAILLILQGRGDAALTPLGHALRLDPGIAALWLTRGEALHGLGRETEALDALERAVALSSPYPAAEHLLGVVLLALDRPDDAVTHFVAVLSTAPDHAEALGNLGLALYRLGRHAEAARACETSLLLQPDSAATLQTLGAALHGLGCYDEALARFNGAVAIRPGDADLHYDLGVILTELGRFDKALPALDRAIALDPAVPRYYRARALFGLEAQHVAALEALSGGDADLPEAVRTELHFALGRAYADLGRPEAAITQWLEGNRLKRRSIVYDEAATLERIACVQGEFTAERLRRLGGESSTRPVFIIGMLRSGSTLIEQILASHPDIFGAGEIAAFPAALAEVLPGLAVPDLGAVTDGQLAALGAEYLRRLQDIAPDAGRVTDKMLANFMFVGLIHLALPRARIIHVRRDPLDTCLSCFSKLFVEPQPFTYDLGELGRYYQAYQRLMAHWRTVLPEGVMLEVDYAALIADPEAQARGMLDFLGLDWDPACLVFHQTVRPVRTTSMVEVRRPIYRDSLARSEAYRPYLGALLDGLAGEPAR